MHCTLKQLNEELKYKKPSEQVFFVPDSAEEVENFCEDIIKQKPRYIIVRLNPNRDMLMQLSDFLDGYNLDFTKLDDRFFDVGIKTEQQIQEIAGRKQKLVIVVNSDFGSVSVKTFSKHFLWNLENGFVLDILCFLCAGQEVLCLHQNESLLLSLIFFVLFFLKNLAY